MKTYAKLSNNHIIKRILPLLLVVAFLLAPWPGGLTLSASRASSVFNGIGTQDVPQRPATISLQITGQVPTFNTGSSLLDAELTARLDSQINSFIQNNMAGALSVNFEHETFISDNRFVSVVLRKEAISVSTTSAVATTVIDASGNGNGSIINLTDYNPNILPIVNNHINRQIAERPHGFASFSGINANHPFYLDGERLVILFGSGELIPTQRDIHDVTLSINNIEQHTFSSNHFRVLPPSQYSTIVVRVADVMREFGYDVQWRPEINAVEIRLNGSLVSTLTIGENTYRYGSGRAHELEVAPIIHNGLTYVPISFFNEVVGMPTTASVRTGVVVSRYRPDSGISAGVSSNRSLME